MTGPGTEPDASTARRAAVLGHPIAHSLSPVLHRTAYQQLGLDWTYEAFDVTSSGLADFVGALGPEWVGLSLTMPLKEAVLPLLDRVQPDARSVRAVNTVVFEGSRRVGYNTDVTGFMGLLTAAQLEGRAGVLETALVIGAGATARSAVSALSRSAVDGIAVSARRLDAAQEAADLASDLGAIGRVASWPPAASELGRDVVVNTVPADVAATLTPPSHPQLLVDVLYDPWPTPLASSWAAAGGGVAGGLELLVRQAVEQVELMTGRRPDVDAMRAAGQGVLDERERTGRGATGIAQAEQ